MLNASLAYTDGNFNMDLESDDVIGSPTSIRVLELLNTFYMPLVIYPGLLGNLLSFFTFTFTHLRARTSSLYMSALALSDFGYLFVLSFAWLNERGINIYRDGLCQILIFLSSVFSSLSVWLTVSFTAERYIAVRYPLWRLHLSTKRRAKVTITVLLVISVCFNSHFLLFVGVNATSQGEQECTLDPGYQNALYYINIIDTVLTLFVPLILIAFMNSMIARAIFFFYSRHRRQRSFIYRKREPELAENHNNSNKGGGNIFTTGGSQLVQPSVIQISVTRMLLLVSTVFVLLNIPSYVIRIYVFVLTLQDIDLQTIGSTPFVLQRYFMLLYYTNFAINFVLYNVSSRMFRVALNDYISSRWTAFCTSLNAFRPSTFSHNSSSTTPQAEILL